VNWRQQDVQLVTTKRFVEVVADQAPDLQSLLEVLVVVPEQSTSNRQQRTLVYFYRFTYVSFTNPRSPIIGQCP
jgi:hypothetical protein